jgi:hypothetical protein
VVANEARAASESTAQTLEQQRKRLLSRNKLLVRERQALQAVLVSE